MDLLDDLDDLSDNEATFESGHTANALTAHQTNNNNGNLSDDNDNDMDEDDDDDEHEEREELPDLSAINSVNKVAHLLHSKRLTDIMEKIAEFMASSRVRVQADNTGPVEDDPEYKVLVNANNVMFDVDSEIVLVHKFIRDKYSFRFPELETLVPNALDYARAVKAIGNEMDVAKLDLKSLLPASVVMIITVTASGTNGKPLDQDQLNVVLEACDMALELENVKRTILEYVESRMQFLAPNLTAILGSTTAAKLMGAAGGLTALSKIPSCNLIVIGKLGKSDGTGIFTKGQMKHAGYIYYSEMVQMVPKDYRNKAQRMIAAKCALAARLDRARETPDGNAGKIWRDDIAKKLEKAMEPPPGQSVKALPIPNDGPKKKRGGKRHRAQKERMAATESQKAQNRMKFGEAEDEIIVGDTVMGLGLLGGQTGKIRTQLPNPKKKLAMAKKHRSFNTSGTTSGLSSSLAFTPVQGIELENPELVAQRKAAMKDDKYFGGFKRPHPLSK
ncbi:UNVERIFIED_CONTAM: U4/U6 small nuclear ribonucleoprotein Prp31 [Siphonaria sp. JEL0065]|nr:U4/U6 small nuclear ribonucleoprotein Prp31 [Siphonaria sp. JEL0065]